MTKWTRGWTTTVYDTCLPQFAPFIISHFPLKRIFDFFFSATFLLLLIPFFLLLSCLLLVSGGGILYQQERIGRGGKPFTCYKFRTMVKGADQKLHELLQQNPELKTEWEQTFKLKEDPRVTRLGRFLRKTSLDELPQLWNVFKGDLSLVGPRPVVKSEVVDYLGLKAKKILSIRPGLTGLWQLQGRSDTTYQNRLFLDEKYVDTHSFLLDLKLIAQTIPHILYPRGAY